MATTFARLALNMPPGGLLGVGVLTPEEEEQLRLEQEAAARAEAERLAAEEAARLAAEEAAAPPAPDPEKTYNIEDAIRELGMTPAEAEEFVASRGQPSPFTPLDLPLVKPKEEEDEEEPAEIKAKEPKPLVKPKEDDEKPLVKEVDETRPLVKPTAAQMAELSIEQRERTEAQAKREERVRPEEIDIVTPLRQRYDRLVAGYIASNPRASAAEVAEFAKRLSEEQFPGEGFAVGGIKEVMAVVNKDPRAVANISWKNGKLSKEEIAQGQAEIAAATGDDGLVDVRRLQRPYEGDPVAALGYSLRGTVTKAAGGLAQAALGEDLPLGLDDVAKRLRQKGQELGAQGDVALEKADPGYAPQTPEWYAFNAVRATAELGVAMGGTLAGGPTLGATIIATRVFGDTYDTAITSGRTPEQAFMDAGFSATAEFIPERMVLKQLLGSTGKVALDAVKGGMAEGMQEMVTEALQIGYDMGVLDENTSVKEALQRLTDAGILGAAAGGTIGAGVGAASAGADSQWAQAVSQRWQQRLAIREIERTELPTTEARPLVRADGGKEAVVKVAPTPAPVNAQGDEETFIIPNGQITSRFGPRKSFTTANGQKASSNHAGIDIGLPAGAPVQAGASGVVTFAGKRGGYGNQVVITFSDGTSASYSHLSEITVGHGASVNQGEVVGKVGATGNATGPHLHLERRDRQGRPVNPLTGKIVRTEGKEDDTPWQVAEAPFTEELSTPWPEEEIDQTWEEATGQSFAEEGPEAVTPEPSPPALTGAAKAVAEGLRGSPVFDTDSVIAEREASLEGAKERNPAKVALENIRIEGAAPDYTQPLANEEPMFDETQSEIVGFVDPQTGSTRGIGEAPPVTSNDLATAETEEFVSTSDIGDVATTPQPDVRSEVSALLESMAPIPADVSPERAEARMEGRAVALGLQPEPADEVFMAQPVWYRTAFNIGTREAENALAESGVQRLQPETLPEEAPAPIAAEIAPEAAPEAIEDEVVDPVEAEIDAIYDKLFDLEVEGTKSAAKRYAQSLVKRGILEQGEVDALTDIVRDRDMTVDDVTSELRSSIEVWADRQRASARGEAPVRERLRVDDGGTSGQRPKERDARRLAADRLDRAGGKAPQSYSRQSEGTDRGDGRVATYQPSEQYAVANAEAGYPAITLIELRKTTANAEKFRDAITRSKEASPYGAAVYVYSPGEYLNMRLFLTEDGRAGFAIKKDGDIVSVFSDGGGKVHSMLALAVEQGGTKLDAFDTVLPEIYSVSGFKEVARDKWNDAYAPENWDKETFGLFNKGEPDIVYMEYDPAYSPFAAKPKPQMASREIGRQREDVRAKARAYKQSVHQRVISVLSEMGLAGHIWIEVVNNLGDAAGSYSAADNIIRINALAQNDIRGTARHEAIHWMVENRLFTPEEWRLLKKWAQSNPGLMAWARANYPRSQWSEEDILEEAVAEGFARWSRRETLENAPNDAISKLLERIKEFVANLRRAFTQAGISRAEMREAIQLLADIDSGKHARKLLKAPDRQTFGRKRWNDDLSREMLSGNITPEQHWFLNQHPGERFQSAWHGSPATDIDKFSLEFIGHGEGAQAFGWGLYFAEKKAVAEWYQRKLTMPAKDPVDVIIEVNGKPIRDWAIERWGGTNAPRNVATYEVADRIFSYLTTNKPYNGWLDAIHASTQNEIDRWIRENRSDLGNEQEAQELEAMQGHIDILFAALRGQTVGQKTYPVGGKLYKVEVPENDNLMDLDKRLSEQSPKVQAALKKIVEDLKEVNASILGQPVEEMDPRDIMEFSGLTFVRVILPNITYNISPASSWLARQSEELQNAIDSGHASMATSVWLRDAGIPGSRYLDRDSRIPETESGPKTANFVIFDDRAIDLKAKYRVIDSHIGHSPLSDPSVPNPGIFRRIHNQTMGFLTMLGSKNGQGDWDAADNIIDAFRRKVTQRYQQIIKTQSRAAKELGVDRLATGMNPMEMLTADERGYKLQFLTDNMIRPMAKEMAARSISMDDLGLYLYARHAPARNARIARINKEFRDPDKPGSGMTDVEAAQIMADFAAEGRLDDLQAVATHIDAMIQFAQQERLNGQLLSPADVAAGFQPGDYYVPLRGNETIDPELEMDFGLAAKKGGGVSISGPESHRMYGRSSRAELAEIVGYSITQAQEAVDRSYRNRIGLSMLEMFRAVPDPEFVKIDRVKRVAVWNRKKGQVEYQMQTRIVDPLEQQRTIYVKEGGHVTKMTFNAKNPSAMRFVKAAKNLGVVQLSRWLQIMSMYVRIWTKSNTQWNIDFVLANAVKDVQTGVINASTLDVKGLRRAMIRNLTSMKPLLGAWWGARHPAGSGFGTGKVWQETYAEFAANGGKLNYGQVEPLEDALRSAQNEIKNANRSLLHPVKAVTEVGGWIDRANSAFENMTRLAAYKALRDAGIEPKRAAEAVRELTTNFQQHGEWGPKFNAAYGFANASVIGGARFAYTVATNKYLIGGLLMLGVLEDMLGVALDEDEWDKWTEEDKHANFIIPLPEWTGFDVKLPIGYGINAFVTSGRKMSELWRGKKNKDGTRMSVLDASSDAFMGFVNSFSPITGSSFFNVIFPTVFDPIVNIYQNQNNWGRPIMPMQAGRKEQQVPDSQLVFDNTSQFWRAMATTMNAVGGGNEVIPGWSALNEAGDVSPESLKHVTEETIGGAGRSFIRAIELAKKAATGEDVGPNDVPVVRRFAGNPFGATGATGEEVSAFYDRINAARLTIGQATRMHRRYREDSEEWKEFRAENAPILDNHEAIKAAEKYLRKYNAADNAAERGATLATDKGLDKKDRRAIFKGSGKVVPANRPLTKEEVAEIKSITKARKEKLATKFNEWWLREVMGQ